MYNLIINRSDTVKNMPIKITTKVVTTPEFNRVIPFVKVFIIRGIGYQVDVVEVPVTADFSNQRYLSLRLGHSALICCPIPGYIGIKVAHKDRKLVIYGFNKEQVSNFAMTIFKLRPPSVYTGRGIRIKKGLHRRKLGKKDIRKGKV